MAAGSNPATATNAPLLGAFLLGSSGCRVLDLCATPRPCRTTLPAAQHAISVPPNLLTGQVRTCPVRPRHQSAPQRPASPCRTRTHDLYFGLTPNLSGTHRRPTNCGASIRRVCRKSQPMRPSIAEPTISNAAACSSARASNPANSGVTRASHKFFCGILRHIATSPPTRRSPQSSHYHSQGCLAGIIRKSPERLRFRSRARVRALDPVMGWHHRKVV